MDDRINKIAEDVAYMRAKIENIPEMQKDIDELKTKASKGIGFLGGVSAVGGLVGAFLTKVLEVFHG